MSHGDTIVKIPENYRIIASTDTVPVAAFQIEGEQTWGIQFHPEVYHSTEGKQLLKHFVVDICGCRQQWTPDSFIESTVRELRDKIKGDKVLLGLSGGVDSSVAAELLHKAGAGTTLTAVAEAFVRVALFLGYLAAISRMEDIQRVFMYHGAEHKCINCVEHGLELNVENVLKSSREHKRCGTSFLMYVIVISIIFFMFIRVDSPVLKIVIRLLLIPVIAGVSYEIIRLAGKSDNKLVNLISKPGLMLQHLTTREPDAEMAEVAIAAVEAVFDWRAYLNENFGYTYPAKTEKKEHEEP